MTETDAAAAPGTAPRGFLATAKEVATRYRLDGLQDVAAGLSFWTFLSIFPALIAFVAMLGSASYVIGDHAADQARDRILELIQDSLAGKFGEDLSRQVNDVFTAGNSGLAIVSVLIALWSMSKGFASLCRALAKIHGAPDRRRGLKGRLLGLVLGIGTVLALTVVMLQVAVGPLFGFEKELPQGGRWVLELWRWLRGPLLLAVIVLWTAVLLKVGPGLKGRLRDVLPGAITTTVMWGLTTVGFSVALELGILRINPILGALGSVLLFLTWLQLMSVAMLLGGEVNALRLPHPAPPD